MVRFEFVARGLDGGGKAEEFFRESDFGIGRGNALFVVGGNFFEGRSRLAENAADAGNRVKEVGSGVAFKGEESLPREHIVAGAVGHQIDVANCGNADGFGDFAAFGFVEVRIFLGNDGEGAFDGFGDEGFEANGSAFLGFQRLAVCAEDFSEGDVAKRRERVVFALKPACRREEKHTEVVALAVVGDVDDFVGVEMFDAVEKCCEVRGGVIGAAVFFAHDKGRGVFVMAGVARVVVVPNDEGTVVFFGDVALGKFGVNASDFVAVETFAERDIGFYAENVIHFFAGGVGDADDAFPESEIFGIALLKFDEFGAGGVHCSGIFFFVFAECGPGFVEFFELFEGGFVVLREHEVLAFDFKNENAEIGAPVADVVVAHEICAAEGEQARDGFADVHNAQMPDVHLFGGVGGRIVDDDFFPAVGGFGGFVQIFRAAVAHEPLGEEFRRKFEIDESGTGDGDFDECGIDFAGGFERVDEGGGECSRVGFGAFGFAEHAVCLIIAEARVGGAHFGRKFRSKAVSRSRDAAQNCIEFLSRIKPNIHNAPSKRVPGRSRKLKFSEGSVGFAKFQSIANPE